MSFWNAPWMPRPVPTAPTSPRWSQRGSATTTVVPLPGVLGGQNLRSWDNWRAFLYSVIPPVVAAVTAWQQQFADRVSPWILIVLAVIGPLLAATNTTDKLRRIAYGLVGLLSTGGFVAALFIGHEEWIPIASAAVTIVGNVLARYYVPTTTLSPPYPSR